MHVRWIFAIAFPLAASQGCGDSGTTLAKGGCTKDTDCKGDRICVAGECVSGSGDSGTAGAGGSSSGTGGSNSAGTGARSSGGTSGSTSGGAGGRSSGGRAGAGGSADSGSPGGSSAGGQGAGGAAGGADAAPPAPECTQRDKTACPPGFPFGACCTPQGTCGVLVSGLFCVANPRAPDGGTGAGGTTGGGGLISPACKSCRATSCDQQLAACNANTACATLSSCIDSASPFTVLNNCGLTTVTQPVRTLYNALSTCASTNCTGCPNINL